MLFRQYQHSVELAAELLSLALDLAVRHEVLPRNPMGHVSRLYREPHIPAALTAPEVNVIRAGAWAWTHCCPSPGT